MRGRILLMVGLALAAMAACSRKDSIYIEPGKRDSEPPPRSAPPKAPSTAPAAKPPQTGPKPAQAPPPKG